MMRDEFQNDDDDEIRLFENEKKIFQITIKKREENQYNYIKVEIK